MYYIRCFLALSARCYFAVYGNVLLQMVWFGGVACPPPACKMLFYVSLSVCQSGKQRATLARGAKRTARL